MKLIFAEGELTFWVQSGGTETEEVLNDITFKLDSESPNAHPLIDIRIGKRLIWLKKI